MKILWSSMSDPVTGPGTNAVKISMKWKLMSKKLIAIQGYTKWLITLDMKTEVVQHVSRITHMSHHSRKSPDSWVAWISMTNNHFRAYTWKTKVAQHVPRFTHVNNLNHANHGNHVNQHVKHLLLSLHIKIKLFSMSEGSLAWITWHWLVPSSCLTLRHFLVGKCGEFFKNPFSDSFPAH